MERTYIKDVVTKIGEKVLLKGWINTIRDHGKITFLDLRDNTGIVQCVLLIPDGDLGLEYAIEIQGSIKKRPERMINKEMETGFVEIEVKKITTLAKSYELPFDMSKENLDLKLPTLLDYRSLTLRHPKIKAVFKVQNQILDSYREYMKSQGFSEFFAPTIVPVATEGGAEIFPIEYFKYKTFLAQSPQLYKQIMVGVFEKAFTVSRAYRAEPSVTTRHMTEYISLDAEFGFINSWQEIMSMTEGLIRKIFADVEKNFSGELKMFNSSIPKLSKKIPRIKLKEAQEIIFKETGRDNRKEPDLDPQDEKDICKHIFKKQGSELVFITHYPTKKRPFYTYPDPQNPEYTYSFDLLGRGLEWVTGGQRINNYEQLLLNIKKWGNNPDDFDIYLKAFKYGMPPEGGFALGLERMTMQILGLANIREASYFPRDMERVDFRLSKFDTVRKNDQKKNKKQKNPPEKSN